MAPRHFVVAGLGLGLAGLVGWKVWEKLPAGARDGRRGAGPMAVPVELAPVARATVREVAHLTGSLEPRAQYLVAPRIAGRIRAITVHLGDTVRKGDVIATLEDDEHVQEVERARAELDVARARVTEIGSNLEAGRREFERVRELREKRIGSVAELEVAEARFQSLTAQLKVADAQITQKAAELRTAEVRHAYTRITAAWDEPDDVRVVGARFVDEGAMLAANGPIVSVLAIDTLTAVIHVIERDYARVRAGQPVTLHADAWPGRAFAGTVQRIAPRLDPDTRQARVEAVVGNVDGALKPGMFVRVELLLAERPDATVVPAAALARRDGRVGVFLAEGTVARFVAVTTGVVDNDRAEITAPALAGHVVTLGHHLLEDGGAIRPVGSTPAPVDEGGGRAPGRP